MDADVRPPEVAELCEVREAIAAMTPQECARLAVFAEMTLQAALGTTRAQDGTDLLQEATMLTLRGQRRWRKGRVPLAVHLLGVVRSLVSHRKEAAREPLVYRSEVPEVETPLESDEAWRAEQARMVPRLRRMCADDPQAAAILEGIERGVKGSEIRRRSGMSEREYATVLARVRRKARALEGELHVQE